MMKSNDISLEQQATEYVSMLLSVQLAVEFNKSKTNKAIKHTLKSVISRTESENVKNICIGGIKSPFAKGWLAQELNRIERKSDFTKDEFIKIGASLEKAS